MATRTRQIEGLHNCTPTVYWKVAAHYQTQKRTQCRWNGEGFDATVCLRTPFANAATRDSILPFLFDDASFFFWQKLLFKIGETKSSSALPSSLKSTLRTANWCSACLAMSDSFNEGDVVEIQGRCTIVYALKPLTLLSKWWGRKQD